MVSWVEGERLKFSTIAIAAPDYVRRYLYPGVPHALVITYCHLRHRVRKRKEPDSQSPASRSGRSPHRQSELVRYQITPSLNPVVPGERFADSYLNGPSPTHHVSPLITMHPPTSMDSRQYSESSYWAYEGLDPLCHPPFITDFYADHHSLLELYTLQHSVPIDFTAATLPAHHIPTHNSGLQPVFPLVNFPVPPFLPTSQDNGALVGAEVLGTFPIQPHVSTPTSRLMKVPHLIGFQVTYPTYAEKATQTIDPRAASDPEGGQGEPQTRQPFPRELASQEVYKFARQLTRPGSLDVVKFVVDGEEGIRLSDALEGNWKGFEGRDDRSLFKGVRLQIILRVHVRSSTCAPH
jgi:hypothetical protein